MSFSYERGRIIGGFYKQLMGGVEFSRQAYDALYDKSNPPQTSVDDLVQESLMSRQLKWVGGRLVRDVSKLVLDQEAERLIRAEMVKTGKLPGELVNGLIKAMLGNQD